MTTAIILGTRPEIIKLSPVIRECKQNNLDFFILHTGQHYSYEMDRVFFEQLRLPDAKYNLDIGSGPHAEQTGKMLIGIGKVLMEERPGIVLVQGDTNTVLAGALAASKMGVMVGHVEAGLRSYDRRMPEETNRVLADHCSDWLFAPTQTSMDTLLNEGIDEDKIFVTGNTIVDAVCQNLEIAKERSGIMDELGLEEKGYLLATAHRQENVDDPVRLGGILKGLKIVGEEFGVDVIFPVHPRTRKRIWEFGLGVDECVRLIDPVDFMGFLSLESNARLLLTDSGGVQEEACIIGVPCVTLRDSTERPETVEVGANVVAGVEAERIVECARRMLEKSDDGWVNPFGDGKAGGRIRGVLGMWDGE